MFRDVLGTLNVWLFLISLVKWDVFNVNDFIFHSFYKNDGDVENMEEKYKTLVRYYFT